MKMFLILFLFLPAVGFADVWDSTATAKELTNIYRKEKPTPTPDWIWPDDEAKTNVSKHLHEWRDFYLTPRVKGWNTTAIYEVEVCRKCMTIRSAAKPNDGWINEDYWSIENEKK